MLKHLFTPAADPQIEALPVSKQLKSMVYFIKKCGPNGASTFDLHAEHFGNISRCISKLELAGVMIATVKKDVIDKRGDKRCRIAHRIFKGFDSSYTGD